MLKQLTRARLIWLIAIVLVVAFVIYRCSSGGGDAPDYQTALVEKTNVVSSGRRLVVHPRSGTASDTCLFK